METKNLSDIDLAAREKEINEILDSTYDAIDPSDSPRIRRLKNVLADRRAVRSEIKIRRSQGRFTFCPVCGRN